MVTKQGSFSDNVLGYGQRGDRWAQPLSSDLPGVEVNASGRSRKICILYPSHITDMAYRVICYVLSYVAGDRPGFRLGPAQIGTSRGTDPGQPSVLRMGIPALYFPCGPRRGPLSVFLRGKQDQRTPRPHMIGNRRMGKTMGYLMSITAIVRRIFYPFEILSSCSRSHRFSQVIEASDKRCLILVKDGIATPSLFTTFVLGCWGGSFILRFLADAILSIEPKTLSSAKLGKNIAGIVLDVN